MDIYTSAKVLVLDEQTSSVLWLDSLSGWYWDVLRVQVKQRKQQQNIVIEKQLLLTTSLHCHVDSWRPRRLRESKRAMGTRILLCITQPKESENAIVVLWNMLILLTPLRIFSLQSWSAGIVVILVEIFKTNGFFYTAKYLMSRYPLSNC